MFTVPAEEFEAYLFDCDGTLIDSMELHYRAWQHALEVLETGLDLPEDLYYPLAGMETKKIVEIFNQRIGGDLDVASLVKAKRQYYLDHTHEIKTIPEVVDFARRVSETHPIAVVTGGVRTVIEQSLDSTGLRDLFEVIVTFEDVPNGKPAPDIFLRAAELLNVDPTRCLVFEDGILGIQGAEAAGMQTVYIDPKKVSQPT